MKKIIARILLTTCLGISMVNGMDGEALTSPVSSSLLEQHAKVLRDFDVIDYNIINQYRQASSEVEKQDTEFFASSYVEPMECLIPLAAEGLKYINTLHDSFPQIKILAKEIESRIGANDITPLWYRLLGVRIQAAISDVSEGELDIYSHVPGPGLAIIKGLKHKDAWKSYEKSIYMIEDYRKRQINVENYIIPIMLSYEGLREILADLEKKLPILVFWNVYGRGKLSVPFLVHSFIHEIFPLGMPTQGGKAHGVKSSALAFTVHDRIHSELDPRRKSLKQFLINEIAAQVEKGSVFGEVAPILLEKAVKHYQLVNEGLDHLFDYYLTHLCLHHDEDKFKKAMAGFFWILHERVDVAPDLYKTSDFSKVLKILAGEDFIVTGKEKSTEDKANYESWIAPEDFYPTSPTTGETILTDTEIAKKAMKQILNSNSDPYSLSVFSQEESSLSSNVQMTKRFIDVNYEAKNGKKLSFSVPTLYHKWHNMEDNIALLKYAGVNFEKPDISNKGEREGRAIVLSALGNVEKLIKELVGNFVTCSTEIISTNWLKDNTTNLQDYYRSQFEKLESD